jgi:hypothetical protein
LGNCKIINKEERLVVEINIAKEYTETPGGRYIANGAFSGEEFRNKKLKPKYDEAILKNVKLRINFDGGYGYPSSFLEEAFGGLKRLLKEEGMKIDISKFEFISKDEPSLIDKVIAHIKAA